MAKQILLIDGNSLIYRAHHANSYKSGATYLSTSNGVPTAAVYSFANMLWNILKNNDFYDVKVAFDKGKKTFRHDHLDNYKAGRSETPEELIPQFQLVRDLLTAMNIQWFELDNFEADDILGALTKKIELDHEDYEVRVLTSDKDMYQIISEKTKLLKPKSGTSELLIYGIDELKNDWNIAPNQVPDLKGLMGDNSDNLKGVKGIGEKTAIKLISEFGSIEEIYANIESIKGSVKQNLIADKDTAFLTRMVATIVSDFEIPDFKIETLNLNLQTFHDFLVKYEMYSLAKKIGFAGAKPEKALEIKIIDRWSKTFEAKENFIFVQSLNTNYHKDKIIGIGIVNEKGNFYINKTQELIQLNFFEEFSETNIFDQELNAFLNNPNLQKNTFDIKKTITLLKNEGYEIADQSFVYDMMIAIYDLDSTIPSEFAIQTNFIDKTIIVENDDIFFGKGIKKTSNIDLKLKAHFIVKKAWLINQLKPVIIQRLKDNDQFNLYQNIDLPFGFVLKDMEQTGVKIDLKELETQTKETLIKLQEIEKTVFAMLNQEPDDQINLASPKQLKKMLFEDLKLPDFDKGSTGKETLEKLKHLHPIIDLILEHRKYSKLYSTYLKGFEKYIFDDQKVHTIFNQTLTNTGRLSSIEPNLQNISIRDDDQKQVRKIFITDETKTFYSFDYSQIELRVLAQIAPENKMLEIFRNKGDIHAEAAKDIFKLSSTDEITPDMRRVAKVFNFGILYGLSDYGLANDLGISIPQAKEYIKAYYESYPDLENWKNKIVEFAKTNNFVLTDSNRKRYISELKSNNYQVREFGKRIAVNMPIQGTAADILKVAMINIYKDFVDQNIQSKMIAQIHDEIIFEIVNLEQEKVLPIIRKNMLNAYSDLLKITNKTEEIKILLEISESAGKNWFDLK
ncbi:DNA polymerase I [Williamsoniiplasma luminosum]|uniref:DNA polymerase I n=1 Tax=Williamsoniiplasma luminosum TaxID=214888 RepID=A0A2K8NWE8_9MOLU|nr:DNA polymerase I [Williamsoniiplasma luminosum]ATZ17061.1 DNA polymerase I [Williamsoniiplasma luminosum]